MDESQTALCSLLAAPGNPWSRLDSKSGHFCNWQWQLTQDAHGKVYKLWHFTNPPPSSLSSADACLADELKNMWSRGCLPDGRRHLPHLLLWAWYQKSFQACKHQEGSRSRWYQWGSSQTLCWPTSASLHKDINLSLAQSVIPTCFKRSTKTGLPDHYRPVELILTGKVLWASGSRITSAADWTHNGLLTILTDQQKTPKTYPPHYPILPGLVRELCEISDTAVVSLITGNNEKEYLKKVPLIPRQQPPPERLQE